MRSFRGRVCPTEGTSANSLRWAPVCKPGSGASSREASMATRRVTLTGDGVRAAAGPSPGRALRLWETLRLPFPAGEPLQGSDPKTDNTRLQKGCVKTTL